MHLLSEHAYEGMLGEGLAMALLAGLCVLLVRWSRGARA